MCVGNTRFAMAELDTLITFGTAPKCSFVAAKAERRKVNIGIDVSLRATVCLNEYVEIGSDRCLFRSQVSRD